MNTTRHLIHTTSLVMRWGDMDALGHLNNTCYFRYMEQARIDWLDSIDCSLNPDDMGPVIAHISCDFKKELIYPATIQLLTFITHVGKSSLKLDHEFRIDGDETIYATGHVVLVWVDYGKGGSTQLPEKVLNHTKYRLD